jgi:transposase-like protein
MKYPANQIEFEEMFKTEQDCIDYLIAVRWPHGFECPVCGSIRSWKKNKGRFECVDCHTETTITNGTIFHKSTKLQNPAQSGHLFLPKADTNS